MGIGINIPIDDEGTLMFKHWLEDDDYCNINQQKDNNMAKKKPFVSEDHDEPFLCSICGSNTVPNEGDMCTICAHEDDDDDIYPDCGDEEEFDED